MNTNWAGHAYPISSVKGLLNLLDFNRNLVHTLVYPRSKVTDSYIQYDRDRDRHFILDLKLHTYKHIAGKMYETDMYYNAN